jgi:hypothetical protein
MASASCVTDPGKIGPRSYSNLLDLFILDTKRCIGEGKENMLQIPMGRIMESIHSSLGQMDITISPGIFKRMGYEKYFPFI